MIHHARHPLALIAVLVLLLTSAAPAVALESTTPGLDGPMAGVGLKAESARFKHPILDTKLAKISSDVRAGTQSDVAIARQAKVSRGSTVAVSIDVADGPDAIIDWLGTHGAQIENVGQRLVEAFAPVMELESLASHAGVVAVRQTIPPFARVTSQGVALHGVPNWSGNGYTGAGVKVGVIDVGFTGVVSLIGSELPQLVARCYPAAGGPTGELSACDRGSVHGSAVAETVIDVAPDVTLYIANPRSSLELIATVDWMVSEGVTIVNHSVGWGWEGPGDGTTIYADGPLTAVERAVTGGITWVNAAGNEGLSTWSGPFLDADNNDEIEFAPGSSRNGVSAYAGQPIDLMMRWDDAWPRAGTDLDLFLVDQFDNVLAVSQDSQTGAAGDVPMEYLTYTPGVTDTLYVAVQYYEGDSPGWIQVQEFNGLPLEIATAAYSIANPAESANPGLLAVGAASWMTPSSIEQFSSLGPTRDGRIKPDVVGIDQADTVSYGPSGFAGTSQASPHVAGLAALVKQRFPSDSPSEVAQYLRENASQFHAPDNTWGYGLAHLPEIVAGENPVPSISSISPASVHLGTFPLTVTVNGSGFVQGSVARWNGQDRPTTYISPTQLTFEVQHLDTDFPSEIQITVSNPAPGGGVSNPATLTITDGLPGAVDHAEFGETWQRTDQPVKQLVVSRTWMWGDGPASGPLSEAYVEAPDGYRSVKYYDKSRMEVTDPNGDTNALWYVTNGLLSLELITGQMQNGDAEFEDHGPAEVPVAGDPDDASGPTYATFNTLLDAGAYASGATITQRVDSTGNVTTDDALAQHGVTAAYLVDVPGITHQVASPFWEFMNSTGTVYENGQFITDQLFENPFYATGYAITEAYWARVKVGGNYSDVLMQCFERRCLTYTPDNPDGWKVEAGNVGLHYYFWRYEMMP